MQFGHGGFAHEHLALIAQIGGVIGELAGGFELGGHIRQRMPNHLKFRNRPAECLALGDVFQGDLQRLFHAADAGDRADQSLELEAFHNVKKAHVLLTDALTDRHANVVKGQFRSVGTVPADFAQGTRGHARGIAVHHDKADAVFPGLGAGFHRQGHKITVHAVGDEGFGTVDDVEIAVALGACLNIGDVRAGVGLGDGQRADLFALDGRHQVLLFEFLAAHARQMRCGHVLLHRHRRGKSSERRAAHLLQKHDGIEKVGFRPAVLFRKIDAEKSQFAHLFPDLAGNPAGFLPRIGMRDDFLFHELPHRLPEQFMISGEIWRPHGNSFQKLHCLAQHEESNDGLNRINANVRSNDNGKAHSILEHLWFSIVIPNSAYEAS